MHTLSGFYVPHMQTKNLKPGKPWKSLRLATNCLYHTCPVVKRAITCWSRWLFCKRIMLEWVTYAEQKNHLFYPLFSKMIKVSEKIVYSKIDLQGLRRATGHLLPLKGSAPLNGSDLKGSSDWNGSVCSSCVLLVNIRALFLNGSS